MEKTKTLKVLETFRVYMAGMQGFEYHPPAGTRGWNEKRAPDGTRFLYGGEGGIRTLG